MEESLHFFLPVEKTLSQFRRISCLNVGIQGHAAFVRLHGQVTQSFLDGGNLLP